MSRARTAYPSMMDRSNGGRSSGAATGSSSKGTAASAIYTGRTPSRPARTRSGNASHRMRRASSRALSCLSSRDIGPGHVLRRFPKAHLSARPAACKRARPDEACWSARAGGNALPTGSRAWDQGRTSPALQGEPGAADAPFHPASARVTRRHCRRVATQHRSGGNPTDDPQQAWRELCSAASCPPATTPRCTADSLLTLSEV